MPTPNHLRPLDLDGQRSLNLDGQRSLELDVRLPLPPHDLRPMLPRAARRLPLGHDRVADPTWGGLRVLAAIGGGLTRLLVDGRDVADRFPDLVASLDALNLSGALLDGEIVVPGARRRRLADAIRRRGAPIRPATFVISDLLWHAGRPLLGEALAPRRHRLAGLGLAGPHLVVLEPAVGASAALQAVALHGLHGIIAKRTDSPYLPGVRSRLWMLVTVVDVLAGDADLTGERAEVSSDGDGGGRPAEAPVQPGADRSRPDIALLRTLPLGEDG